MAKIATKVVDETQPGVKPVMVWDDELKGFHLIVTPTGVRTYGLVYRIHGKQRWLTLGRHGALTPLQARKLATMKLGEIAAGGDPAADKKAKRQAVSEAKINSFASAAQRFVIDCKTELRASSITAYTSILKTVPKTWHSRPVSEIARKDVIGFLDALKAAGKRPKAQLTLKVLSRFFGWCLDRELIAVLPTTRIKLGQVKSRERTLSLDELRRVWAATDQLGGTKGDLIKMLILTGQRRGETGLMRWQDVEGSTWMIPGEVAKNHRTHVVPLSPEAQAIIMRQPRVGPHVFSVKGNRPIAHATFDAIRHEIDKLIANDGQAAMEPWRLHDLRRSLVTALNEYGLADPHTIELIVNHVGGLRGGIAGVYDRSTRMDARRKALQAWAKLLLDGEVGNVVTFRRAVEA